MRKHSVRKWLHAILDLLPVILIPVFMVYSHRHTIDSSQLQVQENLKIDFNQIAKYRSTPNLGVSFTTYNSETILDGTMTSLPAYNQFYLNAFDVFKRDGSIYYFKIDTLFEGSFGFLGYPRQAPNVKQFLWSANNPTDWNGCVYLYTDSLLTFDNESFTIQIFNLTQMFGRGNEPTISEFNALFTADYYEYTLSKTEYLENYITVTYDDTDIMSQITYQLYNATDKYFNMDKTFNLGAIHTWVNNNMFGGQPPLIANIVWHIISYEFIMDLIFLVYAVFMFVIDFADRCLNSFFDKSFGGGR